MLKRFKLLLCCIVLLLVAGPAFATADQAKELLSSSVKGTVTETISAGGYTYLCLEDGGVKKWAAIRQSPVNVGDEVEVAAGAVMRNFTSKSLGRTFDEIVFSGGIINR